MHRRTLLDLLDPYATLHPDEAETIGRFRDFVNRCPDCFERSLAEGHVTGSAWIVDSAATRVLLTHHRKLNRWFQPGGHADGDPDVLAVAQREAVEETGLTDLKPVHDGIFDLDIHAIPSRGEDPEHFHYDIRFLFQDRSGADYTVSEESHDLAWVELTGLETYTDETSMLRMRDKSVAYFRTA